MPVVDPSQQNGNRRPSPEGQQSPSRPTQRPPLPPLILPRPDRLSLPRFEFSNRALDLQPRQPHAQEALLHELRDQVEELVNKTTQVQRLLRVIHRNILNETSLWIITFTVDTTGPCYTARKQTKSQTHSIKWQHTRVTQSIGPYHTSRRLSSFYTKATLTYWTHWHLLKS